MYYFKTPVYLLLRPGVSGSRVPSTSRATKLTSLPCGAHSGPLPRRCRCVESDGEAPVDVCALQYVVLPRAMSSPLGLKAVFDSATFPGSVEPIVPAPVWGLPYVWLGSGRAVEGTDAGWGGGMPRSSSYPACYFLAPILSLGLLGCWRLMTDLLLWSPAGSSAFLRLR